MQRIGYGMLVVFFVALAAGIAVAAAVATGQIDPRGLVYPVALGLASLIGFSVGAYVTGIVRFAIYGVMLAVAPLIGEWLWRNDLAIHHGYPLVFGVVAAIIFIVGVIRFTVLMRSHPVPPDTALV